MIPNIFLIHYCFHIIFPHCIISSHRNTTFHTSCYFIFLFQLLYYHFCPFTSLSIPLGQLFNSVSVSLAFSLIEFETSFWLFSSGLDQCALCTLNLSKNLCIHYWRVSYPAWWCYSMYCKWELFLYILEWL